MAPPTYRSPVAPPIPRSPAISRSPVIPSTPESLNVRQLSSFTQEELEEIDKKMHDKGFSIAMFLADNETFAQVYSKDLDTLQRYGITCKQIADRLEILVEKLRNKEDLIHQKIIQYSQRELNIINSLFPVPTNISMGNLNKRMTKQHTEFRAIIDDKFLMSMVPTMGVQYCPFKMERKYNPSGYIITDTCGRGSADYMVYNLKTNKFLRFSDLSIHLIRDHCFFEGNIPYRVDPEIAIEVLELK